MNISSIGHKHWIYIVKRNTKTESIGPFMFFPAEANMACNSLKSDKIHNIN